MKVSDRQLDRLRLGELEPDEAERVMNALREAGEEGRLDELISAAELYEQSFPPKAEVQEIRALRRRAQRQPKERTMISKRMLFPVVGVAAAGLAVFSLWTLPPGAPATAVRPVEAPPAAAARSLPAKPEIRAFFEKATALDEAGEREEAADIYRYIVTRYVMDLDPEAYLQSMVRVGLAEERASREKALGESLRRPLSSGSGGVQMVVPEVEDGADAAAAAFEKTLRRYETLEDPAAYPGAVDAAAQAQFMIAKRAAQAVIGPGIVPDLPSPTNMEGAAEQLGRVLAYGRPSWSVAAHYQAGVLFRDVARVLRLRGAEPTSGLTVEGMNERGFAAFKAGVDLARRERVGTPEAKLAREAMDRMWEQRDRTALEPEVPAFVDAADAYNQSVKHMLRGQPDQAIATAKQAVAAGCREKCYRVLGLAYHKRGESAQACKWFKNAGSETPADLECPEN